uniref:uncharacterized protein n=1 Tax=Pristiophorus japonicus TaxID=55135 RepID=UPI00398E34A4
MFTELPSPHYTMANINTSDEISITIQQIKEGPKAKLQELCKQYGLPVSGTRVYFQRVLCQRLGIDPKSVIVQKPTSRSNSHGDCCSVAGCRSRRGKDTHIRWFTVIRKKGSHTAAITKAIQFTREGWTPTMYSRICGQHFSCGQLSFEPSSPDYIPHLHMDPIAKAATSHSTFWSKDSSEEAMDLTNKGNIKTSSVHVAGPSHLDFTNQYQSMNSSVRSLLHSSPEDPRLSVTQDAETKRKISHNRAQQRCTGGGPAVIQTLTDLEERAAAQVGAHTRAVTTRGVAGPSHAPPLPAPEAQQEDRRSHGPDPLHVTFTTGGEEQETTEPEEEEEYLETEDDAPCIPLSGEPAATMGIPTEEVPEPSGMQLAMPRRTLVLSQTPVRLGQWLEQRPTLDHRVERLARMCEESVAIQREQLQVFVGFTQKFSQVSASQAETTQQIILELRGISASNHAACVLGSTRRCTPSSCDHKHRHTGGSGGCTTS